MKTIEASLRSRLEREEQGHVLAFFDELDEHGRARLLAQVEALDFDLLRELARLVRVPRTAAHAQAFAPAEVFPLVRDERAAAQARHARERGEELLREGCVAYLLVAGGQASRLGYDGPKGAFPVGPVSGKSLFELFAQRLLAARDRYGASPAWYILTSEANDSATREFFAQHAFFGLERDHVFFFRQAMLPALDAHGRILMSAKDALFLAPNGHGGVLSALANSGGLADAKRRGIETFSYFQVDNPLARPADPLFLGLHTLERAQMSSKVVRKRDAAEKVGVIGKIDGKLSCIEYSDMPSALREARDAKGELLYGAGSIAVHAIDLAFIDRLTRGGLKLPWHLARKQMDVIDPSGRPARVDGVKFETFVFDALQFTTRSVTLAVDRALEFSPVKNAQGLDSPATARADMCRLFASWVGAADLPLPPTGPDGLPSVEVDPRIAEDLESFLARRPERAIASVRGDLYA